MVSLKLSKNAMGMLVSKYRSVLKKTLIKNTATLAASCFLFSAAPAAAQVDYYNYTANTTTTYQDLETLRTAGITFGDDDIIKLYDNDSSLKGILNFSGKRVTIDFQNKPIAINPHTGNNFRFITIADGKATFANASSAVISKFKGSEWGGAAYIHNNSEFVSDNVVFNNNEAVSGGGAVVLHQGKFTADSVSFSHNNTGGWGGAAYIQNSTFDVNNVTFNNNTGGWGGAVYLFDSSEFNADKINFSENSAHLRDDKTGGYGGAVHIQNSSTLTVKDAVFEENYAKNCGGAVNLYSGTFIINGDAVFSDNVAEDGAGGAVNLYNGSTFTTKDNTTFSHNITGGWGGAINIEENSVVTVNNATFTNNTAEIYGGAVSVYSGGQFIANDAFFYNNRAETQNIYHPDPKGGAVRIKGGTFTINNAAVFSGNYSATDGGAVYLDTGSTIILKNATFTNNSTENYGGAMYLSANGGDTEVSISTDLGQISVFEGNTANNTPNSIYFDGLNNTNKFTVSGEGILKMLDPMNSTNASYNISISKTGSSIWELSRDNQFKANGSTGTTFTVQEGTLDLYKDAKININKGSFTLGDTSGATIISRGSNTITAPTITVKDGSTLGFDLTGAVAADAAGATTNLTLTGTGGVSDAVNIDIVDFKETGTYNLVTATGGVGSAGQTLTVRGENIAGTRLEGTKLQLNSSDNNTLQVHLTLAESSEAVIWTGDTGNIWNIHQEDWDSSAGNKFLHGDTVLFDDSGKNKDITVNNGGVVITGMTVNNSLGNDYSFSGGAIEGDGGLTKNGTGNLYLNNGNTYSGGTQINGGTVFAGDSGALGIGGVSLNLGGRLNLGFDGTFANNLSGAGNLTTQGNIVINQNNSGFSGNTIVDSGTLTLGDVNALGSGGIHINGGNGGGVRSYSLFSSAVGATLVLAFNGTFANNLSGEGNLTTKGNIAINQNNSTFSGDTLIESGRLTLGNVNALGLGGVVTNNSVLEFNLNQNQSGIFGNQIAGSGDFLKSGNSTLILTGQNNADYYKNAAFTVNGGILAIADDTNTPLIFRNISNNARLNFTSVDSSAPTQNNVTINNYAGSGIIGLQVYSRQDAQWIDQLKFDTTPAGSIGVHFYFLPGTNLKYMSDKGGTVFANLADGGDGCSDNFVLDNSPARYGAYQISIRTDDGGGTYKFFSQFNKAQSKIYSEGTAADLGQAVGMHGKLLFNTVSQATADAAKGNTSIAAGYGRSDVRHATGSHADIKGNNLSIALGWKANEKTAWGIFGQQFNGNYTAECEDGGQKINADGDIRSHAIGLFAEYRPDDGDKGHYYQAMVKAGRSSNDFRADESIGDSKFKSGKSLSGFSLGCGYVKTAKENREDEYYGHLIYTRLGSDEITDNLNQKIRFNASDSVLLLVGTRFNFNQNKKTSTYLGAALDYEFSGKPNVYIDGDKADSADLKGLSALIELGLVSRQSDTFTIDLGLQGWIGKKRGLGGTLMLSKKF